MLRRAQAMPPGKGRTQSRRAFIKKLGKAALVTASYSVVSLTQFHCSSSPSGPDNGGDNNGYGYGNGYGERPDG